MAIYLKNDVFKGSSTTKNFENQIEITSFSWGAGVAVSNASGGDRTSSEPNVSEITITKQVDKSTENLMKSMLRGESAGKARISFVAASKGTSVAYITLDIEEVIVSSVSMSSGGDFPVESVSLNFTQFDWSFIGRDEQQVGKPTHLIYSIVDNKIV